MPGRGHGGSRSASGPPVRWGWHPLSESWARRLVADSGVGPGDLVLDVGAGDGALTRPLLRRGARVVAVELHPRRVQALRRLAPDRGELTVVRADARDLRLPRTPFRVVSNPPYDASSALLRRLLSPGSRLRSADLVLQRQTARRWADGRAPGAGRWWHEYRLEVVRPLPRSAFHPPPQVDSVVLRITRR